MTFSYSLSTNSVKTGSAFSSGAIRAKSLYFKNGECIVSENFFKQWEDIYGEIEHFIVDTNMPSAYNESFTFKGLATTFSRLSNKEDIQRFTNQYGLLGFSVPSPGSVELFKKTKDIGHLDLHTPSVIEPINLWLDAIEQVKRLLQLYRALIKLRKKNIDVIEENLITTTLICEDQYQIHWKEGQHTNVFLNELELLSMEPEDIYRQVLISEITRMIDRSNINISPKIVNSNKAPLGVIVIEAPYTPYLITAIYYDLWKMLSEDVQIELCAFEECNLPFIKSKRQLYCNDSCKQAAYRSRKENKA